LVPYCLAIATDNYKIDLGTSVILMGFDGIEHVIQLAVEASKYCDLHDSNKSSIWLQEYNCNH
jgi:hypothetical protein